MSQGPLFWFLGNSHGSEGLLVFTLAFTLSIKVHCLARDSFILVEGFSAVGAGTSPDEMYENDYFAPSLKMQGSAMVRYTSLLRWAMLASVLERSEGPMLLGLAYSTAPRTAQDRQLVLVLR